VLVLRENVKKTYNVTTLGQNERAQQKKGDSPKTRCEINVTETNDSETEEAA